MKKVFRIFLLVLFGVIFIGTLVFLYSKSKKKPVIYQHSAPFVTNIIRKTVATGSVVPRKEVEIKSKVSGIIEKIYVEAGQIIREGDLIARIKVIPDMVNLNNAESRVERANISFNDSKMNYDRQKKLFESRVISEAEFQPYKTAFESAKEELDAAKSNLELIRDGVSKKAATGTNTLVKATIEGMILDVPVKEGSSVIESNTFNDGTTIASIADMGVMIFKGKVDESEVGKLHEGMNLILTIGAIEKEKYDAKLEYISPKGVLENGAVQFEIKAALELKKNSFVRAGYSANADIVLEERDSVLAIQESLLQFSGDTAFVEIINGPGKYKKCYVKTGISDGLNIEILSGLNKKDSIKVWNIIEKKEEQKP